MFIAYLKKNAMMLVVAVFVLLVVAGASYAVGVSNTKADVAQKHSEALDKYILENAQLNAKVTELTNRQPQIVEKIVEVYRESKGETDAETQANIDKLHNDNLRLRVKLRHVEASAATTELACSIKGVNDSATAELSAETSELLIRESGRADNVVHQLTALQAHVRAVYDYIDEYKATVEKWNKENGYVVIYPPLQVEYKF